MTSAPGSSANFCYRHPDRQSYILCQRCGRTICPQCQTQAAVGVHCPECVREARASAPRVRRANPFARFAGSDAPRVTWAIMALCVIIYVLQILPGSVVTQLLLYYPPITTSQPWRMITSLFVHSPGRCCTSASTCSRCSSSARSSRGSSGTGGSWCSTS